MTNLIDLLQSQLSDGMIDQLSRQIGAPKQQTRTAADSILSTIVGGLAKNASNPQGAESLANALEKDHDGSLLDNLNDVLQGKAAKVDSRTLDGDGILNHTLGQKKEKAGGLVSQISGIDPAKAMQLMSMMAPIVMAMLGKQKQQRNLDSGGIADILNQTMRTQRQRGGMTTSLLSGLLDRDGDGSTIDDVAQIGMSIFSKFFRK